MTKPRRPQGSVPPDQVLWSGTVPAVEPVLRPASFPRVRPSYTPLPIFQLQGELRRRVVTGRRTDTEERCELLLVADVGGSFALYPHGVDTFGVRLAADDAAVVAGFLVAVQPAPTADGRDPADRDPAAALPEPERVAVLLGAIREQDLTGGQAAALAELVEQVAVSLRVARECTGPLRAPFTAVAAALAGLVGGDG